ncbi:hypothetical protein [Dokdonia pacifica]|uniref:Uncharacterized protein n=1 Tax=Dokdonia pacifica TaxID=1627892 RepID=A0A239BID5_9FLAO|nr:hypothetical protein [Dokdonia pacifica]SNS06803.1 hypothetical protein SAMN06265376_106146 [Dokdonia pacifica]
MKDLLRIGKTLSIEEQKGIDGGWDPNCGRVAFCDCSNPPSGCPHICVNC